MGKKEKKGKENPRKEGAIAYMARNSVATNLLMLVLLGGGIFTMFNIQKEVFPEFQLDFVEVSVAYPGASPAEVEQGFTTCGGSSTWRAGNQGNRFGGQRRLR